MIATWHGENVVDERARLLRLRLRQHAMSSGGGTITAMGEFDIDSNEANRDREVARLRANAKLFPNEWLVLLSTPRRQSRMSSGLLSFEAIRTELLEFGARYKGYALAPDVFGWTPSAELRESVEALIRSVQSATPAQLWAFYRDQWGMDADPFVRLQREKNAEYAKMIAAYPPKTFDVRFAFRMRGPIVDDEIDRRQVLADNLPWAVRPQLALPPGRSAALPAGE